MDWKLELIGIPVSDVDRAIGFYVDRVGFNLDHDHKVSDELRFVQLTPKGSACSIAFGIGQANVGGQPLRGLQIVVADVAEARTELVDRGVEVSEIAVMPWGSFAWFDDPDGNRWALQQLPPRP